MRDHCLKCPLFRKFVNGARKDQEEKLTALMEHLITLKNKIEGEPAPTATPDAERGTRTLSDLQKARMNAPDAREEPPAGDEPIPDGDPAPAPKTTPPGAITYRHKCTREKCNAVRVNRLPDGVNCPKCGSLMISAQVNPHGSYKKRKGSISKKAAPARNQGKKQAPRGLDALFEQHPAPGIMSG